MASLRPPMRSRGSGVRRRAYGSRGTSIRYSIDPGRIGFAGSFGASPEPGSGAAAAGSTGTAAACSTGPSGGFAGASGPCGASLGTSPGGSGGRSVEGSVGLSWGGFGVPSPAVSPAVSLGFTAPSGGDPTTSPFGGPSGALGATPVVSAGFAVGPEGGVRLPLTRPPR